MIKANELRIGNWIQAPAEWNDDKSHFEDVQVDELSSYVNGIEIGHSATGVNGSASSVVEDCKPIELTRDNVKEWLVEKLGFEQLYENYFILQKNDDTFVYYYTCSGSSWTFELNGDPINIHHVHQLQNLYFAIKGEEIEQEE